MTGTETQHSPNRIGEGFRVAFGIGGLVAIVLGLLIMFFPGKSGEITMQIVAAITAAYALAMGVIYIGTSLFSRGIGGWARTGHIILGLLYIVGGLVMMSNLGATAVVLTVFLSVTVGILWIVEAIMSFSVASRSESKAWAVIYGIISLLAGLTLIFSPLLGAITLWMLLGVSMLVLGVVQVVRAFQEKPRG